MVYVKIVIATVLEEAAIKATTMAVEGAEGEVVGVHEATVMTDIHVATRSKLDPSWSNFYCC